MRHYDSHFRISREKELNGRQENMKNFGYAGRRVDSLSILIVYPIFTSRFYIRIEPPTTNGILVDLLSRHCRLNAHGTLIVNGIGAKPNALCSACGLEEETSRHLFAFVLLLWDYESVQEDVVLLESVMSAKPV